MEVGNKTGRVEFLEATVRAIQYVAGHYEDPQQALMAIAEACKEALAIAVQETHEKD